MKRTLSIMAIVFCSAGFVYSQNSLQSFALEFKNLKAREAKPELVYSNIQGNPYHSNDFIESRVYLTNGDSALVPLRYDLYMDEIEFSQNDKTMWLSKKEVASIVYGTERLLSCVMKDKRTFLYFFVAAEGEYSLLWRQKTNLLRAEPLKGYADPKPTRFESMPKEYFIRMKDFPPTIIYTKGDLKELVSENAPAQEFLKKEKIKPGRVDDLIKFVEFLNAQ